MKLTAEQVRERCAEIIESTPLGYYTERDHQVLESFADKLAAQVRALDLGAPEPEGAPNDAIDLLRRLVSTFRNCPFCERQTIGHHAPDCEFLTVTMGEPSTPAAAPERCTCTPFTNPSTYKIDRSCPEHGHSAAEQKGAETLCGGCGQSIDTENDSFVSSTTDGKSYHPRCVTERAEGNEKAAICEKKLKSGPYLSAACKNGKHDKCWSISCTCQCGHGVYAGMPKKVVQGGSLLATPNDRMCVVFAGWSRSWLVITWCCWSGNQLAGGGGLPWLTQRESPKRVC